MKALSLTQPWATLVAIGAKKIETRSWSTLDRSLIAIHAAKGLGPVHGQRGLEELCRTDAFASALFSYKKITTLMGKPFMPLGAIVAVARIAACVSTNNVQYSLRVNNGQRTESVRRAPEQGTDEFAFGDYSPNRFMWFLEDVQPLVTPIQCKGALSLWEVPADIEAQILGQL